MSSTSIIEHPGRVIGVADGTVFVSILVQSACADCHAKGACNLSEMQDKVIEAIDPQTSYNPGDAVVVSMTQAHGFRAVLLAFLIPLVLLCAVLFILVGITGSEAKAGLFSILILILYYMILYLFRSRIKKSFTFSVRKA